MTKFIEAISILLMLISASLYGQNAGEKSLVKLNVDWPKFMAQHDLVWDKMPADYFEGAFAGNGLLGTIIFKDDYEPNTLRFEIGRTDVYDLRTPTARAYETSRLPIGQLLLTPVGDITRVHMRTDIWNAEIRGVVTTKAGTITFRCFVPSEEELIVVNMKGTGKETEAQFSLRPQLAQSARYIAKRAMGLEKNVEYKQNPYPFVEKMDDPLLPRWKETLVKMQDYNADENAQDRDFNVWPLIVGDIKWSIKNNCHE
jgi:alpha-L-fucosidase 2